MRGGGRGLGGMIGFAASPALDLAWLLCTGAAAALLWCCAPRLRARSGCGLRWNWPRICVRPSTCFFCSPLGVGAPPGVCSLHFRLKGEFVKAQAREWARETGEGDGGEGGGGKGGKGGKGHSKKSHQHYHDPAGQAAVAGMKGMAAAVVTAVDALLQDAAQQGA